MNFNGLMLNNLIVEYEKSTGKKLENAKDLFHWISRYDSISKDFVNFLVCSGIINFNDEVYEIGKMGINSVVPFLQKMGVSVEAITRYSSTFDIFGEKINCNHGYLTENGKIKCNDYFLTSDNLAYSVVLLHNFDISNNNDFNYDGIVKLIKDGVNVVMGYYADMLDNNIEDRLSDLKARLEIDTSMELLYAPTIIDNAYISVLSVNNKKLVRSKKENY